MRLSLVFINIWVLAASGCFKGSRLMQQGEEPAQEVDGKIDANGAITASFSSKLNAPQSLAAPEGTPIAGIRITFPPGSLKANVDPKVILQQGVGIVGNAILSKLGLDSSGEIKPLTISINVESKPSMDPSAEFFVEFPRAMVSPSDQLALIYHGYSFAEGKRVWGVIPYNQMAVDDDYVKVPVKNFGNYQLAYVETAVGEKKETDSAEEIISKLAEAEKGLSDIGWKSVSVSYNPAKGKVTLTADIQGISALSSCQVYFDNNKKPDDNSNYDLNFSTSSFQNIESDLPKKNINTLYGLISCIDTAGRAGNSSWSEEVVVNTALIWKNNTTALSTKEDAEFKFDAGAVDNDTWQTISYEFDTKNMTCDDGKWSTKPMISSAGVITGVPTNDDVGDCTFKIIAKSGYDSIQRTIKVTVDNTNDLPIWLETIKDFSIIADTPLALKAKADDVDKSDTIVYSFNLDNMTCDNGSWSTAPAIDPKTGDVKGTPTNNDVGTCTVGIFANSSGDIIAQKFTINILYNDKLPPVESVNSGVINASNVDVVSLDLTWTKATDDVTSQASIQYLVVRSVQNNIGTVSDALANGAQLNSYTANIDSFHGTNLLPNTTYYFNVLVKDLAGNVGIYATKSQATPPDVTAPTPGNSGTITTADIAVRSMTLNWTAATDNATTQQNIEYRVFRSNAGAANDMVDVASVENKTPLSNWTKNITSIAVTGLTPNSTYHFNVVVRDEAGNKTIYTTKTQATAADVTAPTPGNSGALTGSLIIETTMTVTWTKATDDGSDQNKLKYKLVYSTANNIGSVANAELNGTAASGTAEGGAVADGVGFYEHIGTFDVTGLAARTNYFWTVIVKDEASNKAIYTVTQIATIDTTPPVIVDVMAPTQTTISKDGTIISANVDVKCGDVGSGGGHAQILNNANNQVIVGWTAVTSNTYQTIAITGTNLDNASDADGSITLKVLCRDDYLNVSTVPNTDRSIILDTTPPTINSVTVPTAPLVTIPAVGTVTSSDVDVTCNESGDARVLDNADNDLIKNWDVITAGIAKTINITGTELDSVTTADGDVTLRVQCRDAVGNVAAGNTSRVITLDTLKPSVTLSSAQSSPTNANPLNITITFSENAYNFVIGDITVVNGTTSNFQVQTSKIWTVDVAPSADGAVTVDVAAGVANDLAGNPNTAATQLSITSDGSPPNPPNVTGTTPTQDTTPTWSWISGGGGGNGTYRYKLDNADLSSGATQTTALNFTPASALSEGSHTLYVQERDAAGNWSGSGSFAIQVDLTPPSVGVFNAATDVIPTSLTMNWTRSTDTVSPQASLQYLLYYSATNNIDTLANVVSNGTAVGSYTADLISKQVTGLQPATTYYFNVIVKDQAGNQAVYTMTPATTSAGATCVWQGTNQDWDASTANWNCGGQNYIPTTVDFVAIPTGTNPQLKTSVTIKGVGAGSSGGTITVHAANTLTLSFVDAVASAVTFEGNTTTCATCMVSVTDANALVKNNATLTLGKGITLKVADKLNFGNGSSEKGHLVTVISAGNERPVVQSTGTSFNGLVFNGYAANLVNIDIDGMRIVNVKDESDGAFDFQNYYQITNLKNVQIDHVGADQADQGIKLSNCANATLPASFTTIEFVDHNIVNINASDNCNPGAAISITGSGNGFGEGGESDPNSKITWPSAKNICTWSGTTNTDWATATNWSCDAGGSVPGVNDSVVIPIAVTNFPRISSPGATIRGFANTGVGRGTITVNAGATLKLLTTNDTLASSAKIVGDSTTCSTCYVRSIGKIEVVNYSKLTLGKGIKVSVGRKSGTHKLHIGDGSTPGDFEVTGGSDSSEWPVLDAGEEFWGGVEIWGINAVRSEVNIVGLKINNVPWGSSYTDLFFKDYYVVSNLENVRFTPQSGGNVAHIHIDFDSCTDGTFTAVDWLNLDFTTTINTTAGGRNIDFSGASCSSKGPMSISGTGNGYGATFEEDPSSRLNWN